MRRLLLIEDNDLNRDALGRLLARQGFKVLPARDGAEGVELALQERPDLILMDLGLPLIDGHEATRLLRATPATAGIPIIALTAHAMDTDREAALASGCDAFETKPVVVARLVQTIEALLAGDRRTQVVKPGPPPAKEDG
ncbi:MAG: response regulator [Holophagaceae bacterium]|nr:response regulator [Holophagaceae bacterium]